MAALLGASLLTGCAQSPAPVATASPAAAVSASVSPSATPEPAVMPKIEFSAEEKAQAEKLLAGWKDEHFVWDEMRKMENGRAFLFIASDSDDTKKKAEAFKAIKEVYADYESDKKLPLDADYRNVVLAHLNDQDPKVQQAAIEAAYHVVRSKDEHPETVAVLVKIAGSHPVMGGRWKAAKSLSAMGSDRREQYPELIELFFKLYEDEDAIAASAIDWTYGNYRDNPELKTRTLEALKKMMSHEHPVVRGRAIDKFAKLSRKDKAPVVEEAKKLLGDSEPFVIAEALKVLGESGDESVIPDIAKHFDDNRENEFHLKFKDLTGGGTQTNHGGLTGKSVGDAATRALDKVTDGRPDKGFEAEKVGFGKGVEERIAKNVAAAKDWVSKNSK